MSLITRSLTGTSPISSIPYVMSIHSLLTMGTFILILNVVLIIGQMLMLGREGIRRCRVELLMQFPVSVVFGLFVDFTMFILSLWSPTAYWMQIVMLLLGCLCMGLGVSLEVIADVAMVSGEYFVHIASRRFHKEFGTVKIMFDVSLVVVAVACSWILAGKIEGVREGTLVAALLTGPLVRLIMPRLKFIGRWEAGDARKHPESAATASHKVITIAREYGSGGHEIGEMIAKELGIPFYDNSMMEMVARESGMAVDTVKEYDQRLPHSLLFEMVTQDFSVPLEKSLATKDALFVAQSKVIRRIAAEGACVIVGRCSDYVLRDFPGCIHLYIHASSRFKESRAVEKYGISPEKAMAHVARINAARSAHYAYYTGKRWEDINNYDAVFDSSRISPAAICAAVVEIFRSKE
ncbi:MAG: cytidylate kinase family protein [Muribaculaceae bacterium]|nr:cytidylate kinase family protein [Muribaculaceae bacterium]